MPYQYESLSKRRPRLSYSDVVTAEAPMARQRHFEQKSYGLAKEDLAQKQAQFDEEMAFAQQQAREQKTQSERARRISSAGTGAAIGAYMGTGTSIGGPVGGLIGLGVGLVVNEMSLLCSAINKYIGVEKAEMRIMLKLREWILNKYPTWVKFYEEAAPIALENARNELGLEGFEKKLGELRTQLFGVIPVLIQIGDMQSAFKSYKKYALKFILDYAPELKKAAEHAEEKEVCNV